jgi:hypothetical protein
MTRRYAIKLISIFAMTCVVLGTVQSQDVSKLSGLLDQFRAEPVFFDQLEVAQRIVRLHDVDALPALEDWLRHEDRHIRGNTAFVFAGLGDKRGLTTIFEIIDDQSDRELGQGIPGVAGNLSGRWWVREQIRTDRYYAVHLLGVLEDRRAVKVLLRLQDDPDLDEKVRWALGEIRSATAPMYLIH